MIAKIAVSAANFSIDKPYSYAVPADMVLQPGLRVMVPFGRSNRHIFISRNVYFLPTNIYLGQRVLLL